ncbi:MAG: phosphate ABC transporter substrate-binding protein PstS [Candidatus Eisenbacteria bacterium]
MRISSRLLLAVTAVLLAGSLVLPAVSATTLNGAGATFPEPIYAVWMHKYNELKGIRVNYQGIGSSGGQRQITAKTVDFGGSDAPMEVADLGEAGLIQFPMVIGGVVPIVNVQGVGPGELRLTNEALAAVFTGEIAFWDDPAIKETNPDLALPNEPITIVHRADGSGTTWIFTNFLDKVSTSWHEKAGFGKVVPWPVGVGAKGNPGVAAYVQRVNGSIGYVEFAYARQNGLSYVTLKNRSGNWIRPTIESFQSAAANADWENAEGYYLVLTDQPGEGSWPIAGATFILIHKEQEDASRAGTMLDFFDWCYDHGDEMAVDKDYVPVPENVVTMVRSTWTTEVTSDGKPCYR